MQIKTQKIGSSVFVRLPLDYVRLYHLKENKMVDLKENENGDLVISVRSVK